MTPADLAGWTPVSFNVDTPSPSIDWGDLRALRFTEPFFDQTVQRWAGGPDPRLVRTDLDALGVLDECPSLDPTAVVFHLSRCGSTLVSRLLARVLGTLVVAEPSPLNDLLLAEIADDAKAVLLRRLVRAFGRRRFGDERRFVLKTSSWNVRCAQLFRRAFPGVPVVWVQRSPAEIMASLLADPPAWLKPQSAALLAPLLFGLGADALARFGPEAYAARALTSLLEAASGLAAEGPALVVDYRDLPHSVWTDIAAFLDFALDPGTTARLKDEAQYYSKAATPRRYAGDAPERRAVAETLQTLASAGPEPLYRALGTMAPAIGGLKARPIASSLRSPR